MHLPLSILSKNILTPLRSKIYIIYCYFYNKLISYCLDVHQSLSKNELFATGTTGRLIEEVTNLNIHKYLAGHLGGEQQICAQIEHNQIDLVIFLRDPLNSKSHEPDVNNAVKLCDMHNIPLATNLASAELLIKSLDRGDLDWREMYK